MNLQSLVDKIFDYGKKQGITDMEVVLNNDSSLALGLFEGELDEYSLNDESKLTLKCIYNGKAGSAYTEKIDESSIKILVDGAIDNAKINNSDDEVFFFEGSKEYRDIDTYTNTFENVDDSEKIKLLKEIEKAVFACDKRITSVSGNEYKEHCGEVSIINTKGLNVTKKSKICFIMLGAIAKEDGSVASDYTFKITRDFKDFNAQELAKETVAKTVGELGADSIKSGNYNIVINNDTMSSLLKSYAQIFYADKVQNNLSQLAGKIGEKIADSKLTIIDNPLMEKGFASTPFDDEGVACTCKKLIESGVLKGYLYNLKTAKKDNVTSTGNGFENGEISPTNLCIEAGNKDLDTLLQEMNNGLLVTDLSGLHAGLNAVSGDFSLIASGFLVENGKKTKPVNQITVSGNFFNLINEIQDIGSDLFYGPVMNNTSCICPSIRFKKLTVAGK